MRSRVVGLVLVPVLLLSVCVAGFAAGGSESGKEKVLNYGLEIDVNVMDPLNTVWMTNANQMLYETLITKNPDGSYVPGLAQSWDVSEDGLTWTFHLKPGVKFQDGTDCDAEAVKWYLEEGKKAWWSVEYQQVQEVIAKDKTTLVLKQKKPDANLMYGLTQIYCAIQSPTAKKKYGADYGTTAVVGTGPFEFVEWVPGSHMTMKRWDGYTKPYPKFVKKGVLLDKVVYKYYPEAAARTAAYEAGDLDILQGVPPQDLGRLEARKDTKIMKRPRDAVVYIGFNFDDPIAGDINFRKAVAHAVQRDTYVKVCQMGNANAAYSWIPDHNIAYLKEAKQLQPDYNVAKAKEYLAKMGYTTTNSDGILVKDGKPLQIRFWTTNETQFKQLGELVYKQLREVGIDAKVESWDVATTEGLIAKGGHQVYKEVYDWDNPDIMNFLANSANIPMPNMLHLRDAKVDDLLARSTACKTIEERNDLYRQFQKRIIELQAVVPLYVPYEILAVKNYVKGFQLWTKGGTGYVYEQLYDVTVEK
jgi:peptide/nickel transport system substrate-binding protein